MQNNKENTRYKKRKRKTEKLMYSEMVTTDLTLIFKFSVKVTAVNRYRAQKSSPETKYK